jgi:translation initiation factor 2-alpha kinase 4
VNLSSNSEKWSPPEYILLLKPQKGLSQDEVHATVQLRVKFPCDYPQSHPSIKLENGEGISSKDIEKLQLELEQLCKEGVGGRSCFQLGSSCSRFFSREKPKTKIPILS